MSGRYSSERFREAVAARRSAVRETCENCGGTGWLVAAHSKSRNLTKSADTETKFYIVHHNLHAYEHSRANNLKNDPCVARFLDLYGEGGFDPWPARLEYTPKGMEHREENDEPKKRPGKIPIKIKFRPSWNWEDL